MKNIIISILSFFVLMSLQISTAHADLSDEWGPINISRFNLVDLKCEEDFKEGRNVHDVDEDKWFVLKTMEECTAIRENLHKAQIETQRVEAKKDKKIAEIKKREEAVKRKRYDEAEKRVLKHEGELRKTIEATKNDYSICWCNLLSCTGRASSSCVEISQCKKISKQEYFSIKSDRAKVLMELGPKRFCINPRS